MKHIGLVLSGGMGKGAYQIGALTAIDEFFKPSEFEYVSAASIGVLNAYSYLTNNMEKAIKIWKSVNPNGKNRFITSVLKGSFLQDVIPSIISTETIVNNFYVPLFDLKNRELIYCNFRNITPMEVEQYLHASVAIPFYSKGINIEKKFFLMARLLIIFQYFQCLNVIWTMLYVFILMILIISLKVFPLIIE